MGSLPRLSNDELPRSPESEIKQEDSTESESEDSDCQTHPSISLPSNFHAKWSYQAASSRPSDTVRSSSLNKMITTPEKRDKNRTAKAEASESSSVSSSIKRSSTSSPNDHSDRGKKKQKKGYSDPQKYAHLKPLPDILAKDLDILFCGINPGIQSATQSHHFAHATNHFYPSLYHSGITQTLIPPSSDYLFPSLRPFSLGLTNLCSRPTVSSTGLSKEELFESVHGFMEKVSRERPKVVCFVGKGVGETVKRWIRENLEDISKGKEENMDQNSKNQDLGNRVPEKYPQNSGSSRAKDDKDRHYLDLKPDFPLFNEKKSNVYGFFDVCLVHPRQIEFEAELGRARTAQLCPQREIESEARIETSVTLFYVTASTSGRVTSAQLKDKIAWMTKLRENVEVLAGKLEKMEGARIEGGRNQALSTSNGSPIKLGHADTNGLRLASLRDEKSSEVSTRKFGFKKIFIQNSRSIYRHGNHVDLQR